MCRLWARAAALLGVVLATAAGGQAQEARSPVAGTWKLSAVLQGQAIALAIVRVEVTDGKAEATVLATGPRTMTGAKVTAVRIGEQSLHLTFKTAASALDLAAYRRKEERRPRELIGSIEIQSTVELATLERTTEKQLDPDNLVTPIEGADELKTLNTKDDKERDRILKALLEKHDGKPLSYAAAQRVWQHYSQDRYDVKTTSAAAMDYVRVAAGFGRELEIHAATQAARALTQRKDGAGDAVQFAQRAEKLLNDTDSPRRQFAVFKTLAAALRATDMDNGPALRAVKDRLAKLDEQLDAEFEKTAVPFKPEPFAGREEKSSRVAVVELFSSAQSVRCVAADIVFDALNRTYRPAEVILLRYHMHVKQSDPLANPDGELSGGLYRVDEAPTLLINGKPGPKLAGVAEAAEAGYKETARTVNEVLEGTAKAGLDVAVQREGDKVMVTATPTALPAKSEIRLRVLLVEDVVRYQGSSGRRLHHHVVRAVVGDEAAKPAKSQKFTISVSDLRKKLAAYLELVNKMEPFPDNERPLDLKRLKVVALLQDDESREILHAVQVDVPEAK